MRQSVDILSGPFDSEDSYSLVIIRNAGKIALGRKTRGFGAGKLVLPGGKDRYYLGSCSINMVAGPHNAAREVHEETGIALAPSSIYATGMLLIDTEEDCRNVNVFVASHDRPTLISSDELSDIGWYSEEQIPYSETPEDYKYWLPSVLDGYIILAFLDAREEQPQPASVFRQPTAPIGRLEQLVFDVT